MKVLRPQYHLQLPLALYTGGWRDGAAFCLQANRKVYFVVRLHVTVFDEPGRFTTLKPNCFMALDKE